MSDAPSGGFESIIGNISSYLNLLSMTLARKMLCMILDDLVEFQRHPSIRTRDITDFVTTVRFNEMEIKQNLQSESRKLKSGIHETTAKLVSISRLLPPPLGMIASCLKHCYTCHILYCLLTLTKTRSPMLISKGGGVGGGTGGE